MFSPSERIFCISLFILTILVGYISSIYIIYYAIFHSKKKSTFYTICIFKCFCNFVVLSIFLFWTTPLILLNDHSTGAGITGIIHRVTFAIYSSIYNSLVNVALVLAVNRFIAIAIWGYYEKIFKLKVIYVVLLILSIYATYKAVETYNVPMIYRGDIMTWEIQGPADLTIVGIVFYIIGGSTLLNFITLFYVVVTAVIRRTNASTRVLQNSKLFVQAFLQDLIFVVDITFMFFLSQMWDNDIFQFICANYTSLLVHALDGPIMLIFQPHMLIPLMRKAGVKEVTRLSSWATPRNANEGAL